MIFDDGPKPAWRPLAYTLLAPTLEVGDTISIANGPTNPDGSPALSWAFVRADTADYSAVQGVPDVYVLPDAAMDILIKTIARPTRNKIKAVLRDRGLDDSIVDDPQATVRDLCNFVGISLQGAGFDVSGMGEI